MKKNVDLYIKNCILPNESRSLNLPPKTGNYECYAMNVNYLLPILSLVPIYPFYEERGFFILKLLARHLE